MKTTVIICTWNRAATLDRTLSSFRNLTVPPEFTWELLIVNNNCTDDTGRVVEEHARHLPIHQIFEPRSGLSFARNRGVAEARGDLIVWADDDVTVHEDWLASYMRAAVEQPEVDFWGGPIEPLFEEPAPDWLARAVNARSGVESIYACVDWADDETEIDERKIPCGANYAIRTHVQRRYPYDTELGRKQKGLLAGEETAVMLELLRNGHRGRAVPGARLLHRIPEDRMTLEYICRCFEGRGRTIERMRWDPQPRLTLRRRAFFAKLKHGIYRWLDRPDRWVRYKARCHYFQGRLAESRRRAA